MTWFIDIVVSSPTWTHALVWLVCIASVVTCLTPTKVDNLILGTILKALNMAALNVHRNRNADDE